MLGGMGNRERLLAGAKQCLYEKGYRATTARDIARTAGVSLAAIGYHFGSTEALLNQALFEAVADWGEELGRALSAGGDKATPMQRFEAIWTRVLETFAAHRRLWAIQFELIGNVDHAPDIRQFLVDAQRHARSELAALFAGIDPAADRSIARRVGAFHQALLAGVMSQWLVDPDQALSARELTDALRSVSAPSTGDGGADGHAGSTPA
jgi:AcrR family transcriptional regulator